MSEQRALLSRLIMKTRGMCHMHTSIHGAGGAHVTLPPDGVDLVDVDDAGRTLLRLLEEIAHARRAQAPDHLDELGPVHGEEGHAGLVGHRLGQHSLAAARRPQQQHPLGTDNRQG